MAVNAAAPSLESNRKTLGSKLAKSSQSSNLLLDLNYYTDVLGAIKAGSGERSLYSLPVTKK